MNFKVWTWISIIIVVGLLLKFGSSTNYILQDLANGFNSGVKSLTLSGTTGNNPAGGNFIQGA